jgi:hypothetical protein
MMIAEWMLKARLAQSVAWQKVYKWEVEIWQSDQQKLQYFALVKVAAGKINTLLVYDLKHTI